MLRSWRFEGDEGHENQEDKVQSSFPSISFLSVGVKWNYGLGDLKRQRARALEGMKSKKTVKTKRDQAFHQKK
jgi:hypothetical protein